MKEEQDIIITFVKRTPSGEEKIVIKSHDEFGKKIDIDFELERDKFLHPEKHEKISWEIGETV